MATQASAITFISTPGQGYESGLGFVQNYFGMPLALILIAAVFLPIYRRLNVYTAYEYLGQRFDAKTRLLGAALVSRAARPGRRHHHLRARPSSSPPCSAGGWTSPSSCSGLLVIIYTVAGGSQAVSLTQKYQMAVIFGGMVAAFVILLAKLPTSLGDAFTVAGGFDKLDAVSFSTRSPPALHLLDRLARRTFSCRCPISAPTSRRCSVTFRLVPARKPAGPDVQCRAAKFRCSSSSCCSACWCLSFTSSNNRRCFSTRPPGSRRSGMIPAENFTRSQQEFNTRLRAEGTTDPANGSTPNTPATAQAEAAARARRLAALKHGNAVRAEAKTVMRAGRSRREKQRRRLRLHHVHPRPSAARPDRPADRGVLCRRASIEGRRTERARLDHHD